MVLIVAVTISVYALLYFWTMPALREFAEARGLRERWATTEELSRDPTRAFHGLAHGWRLISELWRKQATPQLEKQRKVARLRILLTLAWFVSGFFVLAAALAAFQAAAGVPAGPQLIAAEMIVLVGAAANTLWVVRRGRIGYWEVAARLAILLMTALIVVGQLMAGSARQ